jgi:hypothetical protein
LVRICSNPVNFHGFFFLFFGSALWEQRRLSEGAKPGKYAHEQAFVAPPKNKKNKGIWGLLTINRPPPDGVFLRFAIQSARQPDIEAATQALDALKSSSRVRFELVADDLGAAHLPAFVKKPQSITDGHLVELARKNSLRLVTLDRGIPGSLFIGTDS